MGRLARHDSFTLGRFFLALVMLSSTAILDATRADPANVFMQVVAHPDDDLLFMNPDLQNTLGSGQGAVTVMMTAAEADGGVDGTPKNVFAGQRQEGLRAAYAYMTGVSNSWLRSAIWIVDRWIEYDYLVQAPQVQLLFINLPDGGDPADPNVLLQMYVDPSFVGRTFIPYGSTVTTQYDYTKATMVRTLRELFNLFQPTHVRTLDPQPQLICGGYTEFGDCWSWLMDDNPDHIHTARFADLALTDTYHGPQGSHFFGTYYYLGYGTADHRGNLSPTNYTRKRSVCDVYKQYDVNFREYENAYLGFFGGTYERYPGSTTWLNAMANGRLIAFAVQDRQLVEWREMTAGGPWIGPSTLGGGPVAPNLDVGRYNDGRLRLVAMQTPVSGSIALDYPRVITAVQGSGNGVFGPWEDLGNPDESAPGGNPHWTGMPAVAINAGGFAEVFARTGVGGVSRRVQTAGGWSPGWEALPRVTYDDIVEGLAAVRANDGQIEVFATYRSGDVAHWRQGPSGTYDLDPAFPPINVASPPTVTKNQDGRLEIFYHEAGSAHVLTTYFTPGGTWSTGAVDLVGHGGIGAIGAMLRTQSGQIMLFARNDYNGISCNWQIAPNDIFQPSWLDLGGQTPALPSAANDATGRVVMAAIGNDARLYIRRETSPSTTGSFGPWTAVGNAIADVDPPQIQAIEGASAYPNPFNPGLGGPITLRYTVSRPGRALLDIFDIQGRHVADLVDSDTPAGTYSIQWNGTGDAGSQLSSGVYLARLRVGDDSWTLKLLLSQ